MFTLEYLDQNRIGICVALCIVALLFIMVGHVYRDDVQLVLKREFIKFPESSIDWWSISHFLLFGLFGFLMPEYPLTFFGIGVAFELSEDYLSADESTQLATCVVDPSTGKKKNKFWCNGIQTDYWYMNPTDPWVNLTGYIIGSAIRTSCVGCPKN